MVAGGTFHTIENAAGTASYTRNNMMGFNATTGAVTSFAPDFDAPVCPREDVGMSGCGDVGMWECGDAGTLVSALR